MVSEIQEAFLKCKLSPGMFPHEWAVEVKVGEDETVGAWVDKSTVKEVDAAENEGKLRVFVLREGEGGLVCYLPEGLFMGGTSFRADPHLIEYSLNDS